MLSHVEKLRLLRAEIDKGIRSLDAGEGRPPAGRRRFSTRTERTAWSTLAADPSIG
jgi:hypothetical protein